MFSPLVRIRGDNKYNYTPSGRHNYDSSFLQLLNIIFCAANGNWKLIVGWSAGDI